MVRRHLATISEYYGYYQFFIALGGGGTVPTLILAFVSKIGELAIGWQILFVIGVGLFTIVILLIIFKQIWKPANVKMSSVVFYPKRPHIDIIDEFVKRHNKVNAVYASGQVLGALSKYESWDCFNNLILLKPNGKHLGEYASKYYSTKTEQIPNKANEISANISLTVDKALP